MSNHRNDLTKVVIHQSLVRPMMFMGGERSLVIVSMMFAGYMTYLLSMRYSFLWGLMIGVPLWLTMIGLLRRMAIADAQMWGILNRAKRYKPFYPAKGRMEAHLPVIKDFK